jgi:hypothetical protein
MNKTFCYEEFCGTDDKIHVRTLIVFALAVAVAITAALVVNAAVKELGFLTLPFYPTEL